MAYWFAGRSKERGQGGSQGEWLSDAEWNRMSDLSAPFPEWRYVVANRRPGR